MGGAALTYPTQTSPIMCDCAGGGGSGSRRQGGFFCGLREAAGWRRVGLVARGGGGG